MSWRDAVLSAHVAVTDRVSHGQRLQSERYFVWQEDGGNDLTADNRHGERAMTGSTDLFTKIEFDPWAGALERSFSREGIAWRLRDTQYETDTGFWHYTWDWEVPDGDV